MARKPGKTRTGGGPEASQTATPAPATKRDQRLAAALRENLRRRKRQQRLKAEAATPPRRGS